MTSQPDSRELSGTPGDRTSRASMSDLHSAERVQVTNTETRTSQMRREKKLLARDLDDACDEAKLANTSIADGILGCFESYVRGLRLGTKSFSLWILFRFLREAPAVARRVLVAGAVRAIGSGPARDFFDDCASEARKAGR